LTEKTVEVTETSEVPVAEKVARLKEEVVVRREGAERTETIRDTVRRDELAVEDASEAAPARRSSS
jgi:stress response protein YsnF